MNWSTETYLGDIVCPRCGDNHYLIATFLNKQYKKCVECGRISLVVAEDNLTLES